MPRDYKREEQSDDMERESAVNVIDLLKEDHRKVKGLFEKFKAANATSRQSIADEALQDLESTQKSRTRSSTPLFGRPSTKKR